MFDFPYDIFEGKLKKGSQKYAIVAFSPLRPGNISVSTYIDPAGNMCHFIVPIMKQASAA
jgi:hypothetical protein